MPRNKQQFGRRVNNSSSSKQTKNPFKFRNKKFDFVNKIPSMNDEQLDAISITFYHFDGTRRVMPCNKEFFFDYKGRRLRGKDIYKNINTLKHDFQAKYFTIS